MANSFANGAQDEIVSERRTVEILDRRDLGEIAHSLNQITTVSKLGGQRFGKAIVVLDDQALVWP